MDSTSKPFYKSKSLWGVLIAVLCQVTIGLADAQVFDASPALRSQLTGLSVFGMGLAGYGRMMARSSLDVRPGK